MLCDNLEDGVGGGREVQEGGDICIPMADSCWWMAEPITILYSNYHLVKNKIKKNKQQGPTVECREYILTILNIL